MPFRGERSDDLVEHRDGQFGEFAAARAVTSQNLAREREDRKNTVERRLLVTLLRREGLRGGAGEQFDIELPRGGSVRVARLELTLKKTEIDLEGGKPPPLQKVAPVHGRESDI